MPSARKPNQNRLLAALTPAESARLIPHLQLVRLHTGETLFEAGARLQYVYFPVTAIVSQRYMMENGVSAEAAVVGNEGMLGISLFMGGNTKPGRALVRTAGYAYKLKAPLLVEELNRAGPLQYLLLRYARAVIMRIAQAALCHRQHTLEQQLCRLLLLALDCAPSNAPCLAQELVADLLGVRREAIAEVAVKLQNAGYIRYFRGRITVLDGAGLGVHASECDEIKLEADRSLRISERMKVPAVAFSVCHEKRSLQSVRRYDNVVAGTSRLIVR